MSLSDNEAIDAWKLEDAGNIDAKWDELLSSPESHAFLDKLGNEALAEGEKGNLIPGGFDGVGEFSDDLETAVKALIAMVREGMTEREQQNTAGYIHEVFKKRDSTA